MRNFKVKVPPKQDVELYYDREEAAKRRGQRSQAEGNLDLLGTMDLMDLFLKDHQLSFIPHKEDPTLIKFPFLFIPPPVGARIVNLNTKEIYRVEQILIDPKENKWNGVVKLNVDGSPPSNQNRDSLSYMHPDLDNYVTFESQYPSILINQSTPNTDGVSRSLPPLKPTITWEVVNSTPGTLDKISSNKVELSPRYIETKKDPLVPGYSIEIFRQAIDNIVQFDIWSTKPRESEELVRWFQGFVTQYSPGLKRCGLSNIYFYQRLNDDLKRSWRQGVYVKSIQYFIRTEEIHQRYVRDLTKLDIHINSASSATGLVRYANIEDRYIAGQLVTGQITNEEYNNLFYRSGEYMFGETIYND